MVRIEKSTHIDVPVEDAFRYMDTPSNQAEVTPSLVESELIERLPNGGSRATWAYKMAGVRLEGEVRATTYEPPERIEFAMEGDLTGRIWWTFEAEDGGTRVTYGTEYEVPVPVLQQVAEAFARRYNEREVETLLRNLKDRLESEAMASE
jgi:uncharacterized protein YndB with AHSA1/START domain